MRYAENRDPFIVVIWHMLRYIVKRWIRAAVLMKTSISIYWQLPVEY